MWLESSVLLAHNSSMSKKIISVSRDVMGGTPVFIGTRVPVQTFIEYLEAGNPLIIFLKVSQP